MRNRTLATRLTRLAILGTTEIGVTTSNLVRSAPASRLTGELGAVLPRRSFKRRVF